MVTTQVARNEHPIIETRFRCLRLSVRPFSPRGMNQGSLAGQHRKVYLRSEADTRSPCFRKGVPGHG